MWYVVWAGLAAAARRNMRHHGTDTICGATGLGRFAFYENRALSNSPKNRAAGRTAFSRLITMVRDRGNKKSQRGRGEAENVKGQGHVFPSTDGALLRRHPR